MMDQENSKVEAPKIRRSYLMESLIVMMCTLMLVIAFSDSIMIKVPAGHKGVLFRPFNGGTVVDRCWEEGIAFILPWDEMTIYDTRVISGQDTIDALTIDGLLVSAQISYRYSPLVDSLGYLHKRLGADYAEKLIIPHVTGATREVISRYRVDALYNTSRDAIQMDMLSQVRSQVDAIYPLITIDLIVRNIKLDDTVEQAIARKLVQEQEMLGYDFLIEKQTKESERSNIEAQTIRNFQTISGIDVLKMKGIEATQELAKSPNSKIIIIGTNEKELPIIFGGN